MMLLILIIKTRLKAMAYSCYYSYTPESRPLNISKVELLALRNSSQNKEIAVLHPDKGNGVVILNQTDYVSKIESLLEDATEFRPLDTDLLDLCIKHEGKLIRYLRDTLLKNDIISESIYKDLFPTGSKLGILYGLPKVHKENCLAWPIMSAIGTYNYRLAKFLIPILQPFSINRYSVLIFQGNYQL